MKRKEQKVEVPLVHCLKNNILIYSVLNLLIITCAYSQKIPKDSIYDSRGIKLKTYIQYDILNKDDYYIVNNLLMYNSEKFKHLRDNNLIVKKKNNFKVYSKKSSYVSFWISRVGNNYLVDIHTGNDIMHYELKLKSGYKLKLTHIEYPIKDFNFYWLYFVAVKEGGIKNAARREYISLRFEAKKGKHKIFFSGYV